MTDTLLAAFKRIMSMSDTQTSLIQFAFYGSYFCFALPAALFIRRRSFKSGIILGLLLYAAGAMLFLPAARVAKLRLLPRRHLRDGRRLQRPGDHGQPLRYEHGRPAHGHAPPQHRAELQSRRLHPRHSDEQVLHPRRHQPLLHQRHLRRPRPRPARHPRGDALRPHALGQGRRPQRQRRGQLPPPPLQPPLPPWRGRPVLLRRRADWRVELHHPPGDAGDGPPGGCRQQHLPDLHHRPLPLPLHLHGTDALVLPPRVSSPSAA